ncbi:cyclopropane-fatty-acyl-phospholipid synthase family protein [Streptomyces parvulus]|uniref:SAM-dependent methyltransferase n=1 Tax=Streptomyces TaxID=1883 RepID=UPI00136EB0A2|nr:MULTISPECIES: cyclopropane-fatty-acyl-phospholipid synthase family protein [Streptomyces]MCC9156237.1 cyclopropane-fatty-acyl-phospholipid synthase family protein [Streptomyces parvulus]MCE7689451.1 cyclopropane-fatty-acyl-phospholipid synthase family protein [Streptomyces parvulus]MZD53746.1 methyltransferase domain-containing protein [Streptomyces sp. SID5606]WML84113.1 cyclopropane-fatty-acyl-phospholipid synthase family protein [Streptomyces sp. VNUA74]
MTPDRTTRTGAAHRLAALVEDALGGPLPVRLRAWDGTETGPADGPVVVVRSRRALRRLLWQPGELGLAQAYVTGELDVDGDLADGLRRMWAAARERRLHPPRPGLTDRARAAATAVRLGAVGPRPPVPATQARLRGGLHTKSRDRAAISHHYDLSNDFYRLLLDDTMAYSCGLWTEEHTDADAAAAQRAKLELVCRKLGLTAGARLLDIGCGWGSLTLHAAEHHKARVTAVTLAGEQAAHVREQVRERGLEDRVEVVNQDYRDITGGDYDAVSSIEMGEHVGDAEYPAFAASLHRRVRPGGRVLVQQMSRGRNAPGGGAFIEAYIAPDMHMRPLGETVQLLEDAGLEVRHTESLREHYVLTVAAWERTLEERWDEFTALVGEETARVWRLYLVGGALAFEQRRMGVDQILAVRPTAEGVSGMPATPARWYERLDAS